jgi:DNA-binding Xre family transcriptional regulator
MPTPDCFDLSLQYSQQLQNLMQRVGIPTIKALSSACGVSIRQLKRLRQGQVSHMRLQDLISLSRVLQLPINDLISTFSPDALNWASESHQEIAALEQEYQRLQVQLEQQRDTLMQEFQLASLQVIESWLLQWPTAAYAASQNPQAPAVKLLPLVRPVEQLLQQWGLEAIAPVGAELPYDPQLHQLMDGTAQVGDRVRVRYTGYRQGNRLLFRAKVSPLPPTSKTK